MDLPDRGRRRKRYRNAEGDNERDQDGFRAHDATSHVSPPPAGHMAREAAGLKPHRKSAQANQVHGTPGHAGDEDVGRRRSVPVGRLVGILVVALRFLLGLALLLPALVDQLAIADHLANDLLGSALGLFAELAHHILSGLPSSWSGFTARFDSGILSRP
jgi:hypothetical protein